MDTTTTAQSIFVFDAAPDHLMPMSADYYRECQIAGAGSVEVELPDHSVVVISATRYLPADADVAAVVVNDVLQVLCTRTGRDAVIMREFTDWTAYTVRRSTR